MAFDQVGAGLGALGGIVGGILDKQASDKEVRERNEARLAYEKQLAERQARILGIPVPDIKTPTLSTYQDLGSFTPEQLEALQLQQSSISDYSSDPRFKQAQLDALSQLGELATGKLTDADRGALVEAQLQASQADRGRQQAILQEMARRGQGGSGAELASRLQSAQGAADRAAADQREALRAAQSRALNALTQRGYLAGNARAQDLNEAQAVAEAQDRINRANWENSQRVAMGNINARNQAAEAAIRNRQQTANANVGIVNQQAMMPGQQMQQRYENVMSRERLLGSPSSEPFNMSRADSTAQAQNTRRVNSQYIDAATAAGAAGYGAWDSPDSGYAQDQRSNRS